MITPPLTLTVTELLQRLADGATLTRETRREWWLQSGGMEQHISHGAPAELIRRDYIDFSAGCACWALNARGRAALARLKATEGTT